MKTYTNLYPQITTFENLYRAYRLARRGKRDRAAVADFEFNLESKLLELQNDLQMQTYRPGAYHNFYIFEPKRRLVSAVPWSITHNDDPRNGMALCRLCHWTFDEGLAGVSPKYTLLLSPEMRSSLNVPGHLLTLESRPILGPVDPCFMPDLESLHWLRQNIFRPSG